MIVGENIFVMLLVENLFNSFTKKELSDASRNTEVIVCLSADSRAKVDEMVGKAVAVGGTTPNESKDYGFMCQHGFQGLGGHLRDAWYARICHFVWASR
jgi:uncharacterized protein